MSIFFFFQKPLAFVSDKLYSFFKIVLLLFKSMWFLMLREVTSMKQASSIVWDIMVFCASKGSLKMAALS